jgi:glycosyltransferase involved in cell wall biosynthesis
MHILFALGNANETGGWANYARNLEREFAARGIAVETRAYSPGLLALPTGLRHLVYALRLVGLVARADAVLAIDTWSTGLPAMLVCRLFRRPLVVRVGGDFLWEQYVERTGDLVRLSDFYKANKQLSLKERIIRSGTRLLARHAHLAFNSAWLRDIWKDAYGLRMERTSVIENAFPSRKEGVPPMRKNFVAAGRAIRLKNEPLLREVFTELRAADPDIELDTQPLPPEEHQKRIAECYAVVLASVSDVSPNGVIDAVVYGKPFIATSDSGLAGRLQSTGLFVDMRDREALIGAVRTLLDPAEYERIAQRIQAFSQVREWKDVADDFEALLRRTATRAGI